MYLKSLTLKGFKSFADRSVLSLEPGVTAVVGPNGSGKSNISDAVLWVLGERNAKNLRGQVMEDVIFAGSSARKSVGMAEVELVLDNSDGSLPVDFSEVSVTRRMYRSGESEYLINGAPARRMDILDILHDSGMGTGTYSIISQGNLDSILQSKPEDRRALIEEAAGVLKHKQRKEKSERRLEQMEQHLERVQDIVNEVSRQLGPLERKAKKAVAYQGLSKDLSDLNLQLAVDDIRVLRTAWDEIIGQEKQLGDEAEQQRHTIADKESASNELQDRIRNGSESMALLARNHGAVTEQAERFDSQVLLFQEKQRSAGVRIAEIEALLASDNQRKGELSAEMADLQEQLSELAVQLQAAQADVDKAEKEHTTSALVLSQHERAVFDSVQNQRDAEKEEQRLKSLYAKEKGQLDAALNRIKFSDERAEQLAVQCAQAQDNLERANKAAADLAQSLQECQAAAEEKNAAFEQVKSTVKELRDAQEAALRAERTAASQVLALEQLERESMAQGSAARAWATSKDSQNTVDVSPLLHEMKVEPGYELVVERLLQDDLNALLVSDASAAQNFTELIQNQHLSGLVTLILKNDSAPCAAQRAHKHIQDQDMLCTHISASNAAHALQQILGDVVICAGLEDALRLHQVDADGLRFATLSGDIVYPDGRVVFGHIDTGADDGAIARARKLEECRKAHADAAAAAEKAQADYETAQEHMHTLQDELLDARQSLALIKGQSAAAENEAHAAQKRAASAQAELRAAQMSRDDIQKTIDEKQPLVSELQQKLDAAAQKNAHEKLKVTQAQDAVAPARDTEGKLARQLADVKLALAMLAERDAYTQRVLQARADETEKLDQTHQVNVSALQVHQRVQERSMPLINLFELLSASAKERARVIEEASQKEQDSATDVHQQAQEALMQVRAAREALDGTNEQLSAVRVEKGRLEVQVQSSVSAIAKDYQMPLEQALQLPELEDRPAVEEEVFRLKRRIANMGTINPDAAEEYERLKARFDYLSSQLNDLRSARASLRKINAVIDERMKDDFARTFAQANENFKEIFAMLFPGGSAELMLVDPDDIENTGVEVIAQPRGKKIAKMSLMSGGEKSLVALALLFAVYKVRHTPFYILDEVEAALDDTNLRRLISYLNALRTSTQLIMITHQRRTMEMADVLFGVSMQADGVTKVMSQRLEHALNYAD